MIISPSIFNMRAGENSEHSPCDTMFVRLLRLVVNSIPNLQRKCYGLHGWPAVAQLTFYAFPGTFSRCLESCWQQASAGAQTLCHKGETHSSPQSSWWRWRDNLKGNCWRLLLSLRFIYVNCNVSYLSQCIQKQKWLRIFVKICFCLLV
jgi:hypothetical protein